MASIDLLHQQRARRAYELGRWRHGLRAAPPVLVMIALSFGVGGSLSSTFVAGTALLCLSVIFGWRGQVWGRAVVPGLCA